MAEQLRSGSAAGATLLARAERLGLVRFAALTTLLFASLAWLGLGMYSSWDRHSPALVNATGAVIGRDFVALWSAGALARAGRPAASYDLGEIHAAENTAIGTSVPLFAWFYPPSFLLVMAALAALPYLLALALWLALPSLALAGLLRDAPPRPWAPLATLLFPGTAQCLISGQNGIVSAALLIGGLRALEGSPILGGVLLGLLTYKPQMALAVFAALLFGRLWRSLGAALLSAAILAGLSAAVFGIAPWLAFFAGLGDARHALEWGQIPWERMATVFAAARLAGAGVGSAYAAQIATSLAVFAALAWVWARPTPWGLRGAVLALAIPLVSPYAYDYDLVLLLLPMAWLAQSRRSAGLRCVDAVVVTALWIIPVAGWLLALGTHLLITPAVLGVSLVALIHRSRAEDRAGITPPRPAAAAA